MRKFIVIALPVFTIALFLLTMFSGKFLKKPFGENDNVPKALQSVVEEIQAENWAGASIKTDELYTTWQKIVKRVQFSTGKNEIKAFDVNIARLRGAILARDKSDAFEELFEAYEHWVRLAR